MHTRNVRVIVAAMALAAMASLASSQQSSDFIFTDEDGHLVLRFAGVAPGELSERQREEIVNSEFSQMVHDRLRADAIFEVEPVDADWSQAMTPLLERYVRQHGTSFHDVEAECRSSSCRLILEHESTWTISEHELLVPVVQDLIESFMARHEDSFEPVFMIAAHYQAPEHPYIKAYLSRSGD